MDIALFDVCGDWRSGDRVCAHFVREDFVFGVVGRRLRAHRRVRVSRMELD